MRRDYSKFTLRFRELTEPYKRREVGRALGVTASYITALRQGDHGPSRRLLEKTVTAYGLDLNEWLGLAGFGPQALHGAPAAPGEPHAPPGPPAQPAAPSEHYPRGFFREVVTVLSGVYGDDLTLLPSDLPEPNETKQQLRDRLIAIATRAQTARDRRRGHRGGHKSGARRGNGARSGVALPTAAEAAVVPGA